MDLSSVKTFLLDMDGTFYLGQSLLPGALSFIKTLKKQGKSFYFLTNNSSQNALFYTQKLKNMGLTEITPEQIITSGEACAWYLSQQKKHPRVFLLGTRALEIELMRRGITIVERRPDFVVLGFDLSLTYAKLQKACLLIREGTPLVVTHPDLNCPTEAGPIIDAGSLVKAIEASTGCHPKFLGKPHPELITYILSRLQTKKEEIAMVGDRLYTDIALGKNSGITSILVLTGETKLEEIETSPWKPDFVFSSLKELSCYLESPIPSK